MIFSKNTVIRDEEKIEDFLTRGVENIFPYKDFVKKGLMSGKRLKVFLGVDPTGPTLHMGHAIPLRKLKKLQELGHEIVLLIGDFTATIGDPTDKDATRKPLTRREVLNNCKNYKEQAKKIISFSGKNPAKIVFNSKWLEKMGFADVLSLASKMTVEQMYKRDMFEKRTKEGKPIYIHEFMYPLMQGYDSVAMNVDGEIGGNDQTFNMLVGRDFVKSDLNKEKFVMATKLLTDPTGKKMGKTEGNMITFLDGSEEIFGKVMSWTDKMIIPGFEICTEVSNQEIQEIKSKLEAGENPKKIKTVLAKKIVEMFFDKNTAENAEKNFEQTFGGGGVPENIEKVSFSEGEKIVEVLLRENMIASKSEWVRLVEGGAISYVESGEKIADKDYIAKSGALRIGKKKFVQLEIK